jgi:catechol 2,3-dioxygenase-like lactoylglutathione lyase family enzyme
MRRSGPMPGPSGGTKPRRDGNRASDLTDSPGQRRYGPQWGERRAPEPFRPPPMPPPHIASVGFSCRDADALADWYERWLGFERLAEREHVDDALCTLVGLPGGRLRCLSLQLGEEQLELSQVLDPGPHRPGRPVPADSRSNDLWFQHICLVVREMDGVAPALEAQIRSGALRPISTTPQRLPDWNTSAAGIVAFKFHDPDGHPLELLQFPPDKGDARWHQPGEAAVLGVDHSAIGISDPQRAGRFYGDLLGLGHGGGGTNHGPEQDQLDGLQGTAVQIDAWRPPQGMGIESLAYRSPAGGRPMPADFAFQDLSHWQLRLEMSDLEAIAACVVACGGSLISDGVIALGDSLPPWRQGLQVADPDGHRLQLVSR